jgi:hypothetical protein
MGALASYKHCVERIAKNWPAFLEKRSLRLKEQERHGGTAAEKVAENILEDLFTEVLDWPLGSVDHQVEHADMILTSLGIKYLVLEIKRPDSLAWNKRAVEAALDQARRYAEEQRVTCIGISDGRMLYVANLEGGGLRGRVYVSLESPMPDESLWWISVHGIYRPSAEVKETMSLELPEKQEEDAGHSMPLADEPLHPKYKIPARCFAYVGNALNSSTWKLPYRQVDGSIDLKRLPKAIQSILSNYRGIRVSGIPERDVSEILVRLAKGAASIGKMPFQTADTAPVYAQLSEALNQLGRLNDIIEFARNSGH